MTTWGSGVWKSTDIAIGPTVDLGAATTFRVRLTAGSGPVTSFGTTPNCYRVVRCAVDVAVTPSSAIIIPGAASITFHANDSFVTMSDASGDWVIINIERYDRDDTIDDLGLGTIATQNANAVAITGGTASLASLAAATVSILDGTATLDTLVIDTNGTVGSPPLEVNGGGLYKSGANVLSLTPDKALHFDISQGGISYQITGGGSFITTLSSEGINSFIVDRYSANASSPNLQLNKARGTIAAPAVVVNGDTMGIILGDAYDGSVFRGSVRQQMIVIEPTPGPTAMAGRWRLDIVPLGSVTLTETLRAEYDTGFWMYGAVVIDQNRLITNRTATLGTLHTGAAGKQEYATDLGGGAGVLFHDGTVWKRPGSGGSTTVATNADFTLTTLTSAENIKHTGTLTALRTITLSTTGAYAGAKFRIVRTGSGNFGLSVGGLCTLFQGDSCEVVYDGSAWYLYNHSTPANGGALFTATGANAWTAPWDANVSKWVDFVGVSGGGGGGGVANAAAITTGTSGTPGWSFGLRLLIAGGTTVTTTINTGGAGGAAGNNNGIAGGDVTIAVGGGATYTIKGGIGGAGSATGNAAVATVQTVATITAQIDLMAFTPSAIAVWSSMPTIGVALTTGAVNIGGQCRDTVYGTAGVAVANSAGGNAAGYGNAGAGAGHDAATTSNLAGGNGSTGMVTLTY